MPLLRNHTTYFEIRIELRPDLALIETFQDGSQLIHKRGFMIIVDSCEAKFQNKKLKPNLTKFSVN